MPPADARLPAEQAPQIDHAKPLPPPALPVIDIAALLGDDHAAQAAVAAQLHQACSTQGFFYVVGHGLPPALIEQLFAQSAAFFHQPLADKLALNKTLSPCNRGYEPLGAQRLEADAPPDLKESFYIGAEVPADHPQVLAGRFNTGPNQWPVENAPGLHGFRATTSAYYEAAYAVCARLVRAMALSLSLPGHWFDDYLQDAAATLRLLHYPPQPAQPAPGEKGCGAHTDFGGLTLLLQDDAGGLQVWDGLAQAWIDAPPLPGSCVVNIGDLFERWTNGRYRSTLHRVINRSGRERQSVPFFFTGNPSHRVECLPTCLAPGEPPRHAPTTVEAHLRACYQRTYAV